MFFRTWLQKIDKQTHAANHKNVHVIQAQILNESVQGILFANAHVTKLVVLKNFHFLTLRMLHLHDQTIHI